ncbi:hypothetical protein Clacol_008870 [Clathrus columnatus]|uniref:Gfo/Idh/MocA-like oxidoreductase N-terminal domain-containing protein n=1 Tax=Clathrus columnatus TaxID=1419009 RepID=A0AAV5API3_9AGAM|nr:hypothetical protein Clacol_008870 [Clathrus columnatus]
MSNKPVTVAVVGAGNRGTLYASFSLKNPDLCKIVAVAEPRRRTRDVFVSQYDIAPSNVFTDWKDFIAAGRLSDCVIISVQDQLHTQVVQACAPLGYHILCEKPLATSAEECIRIADSIKNAGDIVFAIGHGETNLFFSIQNSYHRSFLFLFLTVLRYTPYNKAIVDIIQSKVFGNPINIVHVEPVGYFHFAHSYVRGNWSREATSSFALLTKCCHDVDILCHYFHPAVPIKVSSFGSLSHFRKSAKPTEAGTATRCLQCPYERECAYSAKKIYLEPVVKGNLGWPANVLTDGPPDIESITQALQEGPYGQCVYESSNDVVDHQVVNIEFSNGATASLTMVAFTEAICDRQTRIHFPNGEIIGDMVTFTTKNFQTGEKIEHAPKFEEGGNHGGGDMGLIRAFVMAVKENNNKSFLGEGNCMDHALLSHLVVFAAEKSRREGKVIDVGNFERDLRAQMGM